MDNNEQYDPEVLRKLQLAQCVIFEDFIKICEKHDLKYFLFAGCAIGVERHGGFIPWDDDIDIGMPRRDYDRFLKIAKRDYSDKYRVLDISVDENFPFYNAEFIRKGTKNVPAIFKGVDIDMGIDIALYPFDNVADGGFKRKYQLFSVFFWHKMRILKDFGKPVIMMDGWKKNVVAAACLAVHKILKWTHFPVRFINWRYMANATRYNYKKTKGISCFFMTTPMESYIDNADLYPLAKKKFEYLTVCVPKNNDKHLTRQFGDYMQLPPVEKRKNHVPYILDFGEFDNWEVDANNERLVQK